jgi:uncharacterized protein (TIGR00156 family)
LIDNEKKSAIFYNVSNELWRYKMKKMLLTLFAMYASMNIANAQATGGFEGPSASQLAATTVQEALDLNDEAKVVLQGNIVNSLGDEKYTFKDATGEIVVEIDDEDWHGVKVTPEDTIEIVGEVDKEFMEKTKIDVKSFTVK